jgi:hypothetical protein
MATDYDAPRRGAEDEDADSIEEVKAATATKKAQSPEVDEDESLVAETFELPGADLSHESLDITVVPQQADEFICSSCFLVHHHAAAVTPGATVCRDCA